MGDNIRSMSWTGCLKGLMTPLEIKQKTTQLINGFEEIFKGIKSEQHDCKDLVENLDILSSLLTLTKNDHGSEINCISIDEAPRCDGILTNAIYNKVVKVFLSAVISGQVHVHLAQKCCPYLNMVLENSEFPSEDPAKDIIALLIGSYKEYIQDVKMSHEFHEDKSQQMLLLIGFLVQFLKKQHNLPSWLQDVKEELFDAVIECLSHADIKVAGRIMSTLLPEIWRDLGTSSCVDRMWSTITTCYRNHRREFTVDESLDPRSEHAIFLLCGIADLLFPTNEIPEKVKALLHEASFWEVLQNGLYHSSTLTRKRAMCLFKRILDFVETYEIEIPEVNDGNVQSMFWWEKDLRKQLLDVYQNYILLLETLEEKQVHVIRPIMPRFKLLVKASETSETGLNLLHTSWLTCLAKKAACHDNKSIQRWIVQELVEIDYKLCPFYSQGETEFFYGPFIKMISSPSLYHKPQEVCLGQPSPLAESMGTFFSRMSRMEDRQFMHLFFSQFIKGMCQQFWGGASLVYVTRALACVDRTPICDESVIPHIRELLTSITSLTSKTFRSASQYYIMTVMLKLIDVEKTSLNSFSSIIADLRFEETWKRGTHLYQDVATFLQESTKSDKWNCDSVRNYLNESVLSYLKRCSSEENKGSLSMDSSQQQSLQIVRLLILAVDAGIWQQEEGSPDLFQSVLSPVADILQTMNTHAYMTADKAHSAMQLLERLLTESQSIKDETTDKLKERVTSLFKQCFDEIILYIGRNISEVNKLSSLPHVELYCRMLKTFANFSWSQFEMSTNISNLLESSATVSNWTNQTENLASKLGMYTRMAILGEFSKSLQQHKESWSLPWAQQLLQFSGEWKVVTKFSKPEDFNVENGADNGYQQKSWGMIASQFLSTQWDCCYLYLVYTEAAALSVKTHMKNDSINLDICLSSLDLVINSDMLPIMKSLKYLTQNASEGDKLNAYKICWSRTQDCLKHSSFWGCYATFLELVFCPEVLERVEDEETAGFIQNVISEIFAMGEEKAGMVYQMSSRVCAWVANTAPGTALGDHLDETFTEALMFGPVHSRGKRFDNEVIQLLKNQSFLPGNQLMTGKKKEDLLVRVGILSFLCGLKPSEAHHKAFTHSLLSHLMDTYRKLLQMNNFRNYHNSLQHRQKHRAFTGLLVLEPFIDETILPEVFQFMVDMLTRETQPSLRCSLEWLTLLLLHKYPHLMPAMWDQLSKASEKRAAFLCSLLSIVAHMGKLLTDKEKQVAYMTQALAAVLPWCMAHHFNIRVYGQATLLSLWDTCKQRTLTEVISRHSVVEAFITFTETNKTACKNMFKLADNFFFKFDPLRDYSMETLVLTLPLLTTMTDEEWIPLHHFSAVDVRWGQAGVHNITLYNQSTQLRECTPGTWRVRHMALNDDDPEEDSVLPSGDVQKKLVPWRHMLPETELEAATLEDAGRKSQASGGLVLVASLIDKIPNLGGLCRTSEIFGISEFIIGSLMYVQDKQFESLSVSAHKWIPIKEVRPEYLKRYLIEMKDEGYTLVGAEQTAQSRCLTDYTFPQKTLLLLGNEKEGIPVDLIQLLDVCVEIPQQGIVRSLNVHVSGALLVWEYTRQRAYQGAQ